MKHKSTTGILAAIATLEEMEDGKARFRKALVRLDITPKQEYLKFWQYIDNCSDKFEESEEDKENAFRKAFGAKVKYGPRKAGNMLRQLVEWIDDFAIMDEAEQSGYLDLIRARYYNKKGKIEKRDKALNTVLEKAEALEDFSRHYLKALAYLDQYFFSDQDTRNHGHQSFLEKIEEESGNMHYSILFKATIERLTRIRIQEKKISVKLKNLFKNQLATLPERVSPLITLQVLVIKFLLEPCLANFHNFKTVYLNIFKGLGSEKKNYLLALLNSLTMIHPPIKNFMEEYHSLCDFGIQHELFIDGRYIEREFFDNIVFVIKSVGNENLLEKFINTHGTYIREDQGQGACIKLAKCYLWSIRGDYAAALEGLALFKFIYPVFNLRMQVLDFICVVETTEDQQEALTYIKDREDGFRKLLISYSKKGHINEYERRSYLNFLAFIKRISNKKADKTSKGLSALLDSFSGIITEKAWIEKKIKEAV